MKFNIFRTNRQFVCQITCKSAAHAVNKAQLMLGNDYFIIPD
jgi:hypothetical protein